ncbi:hypothetical protein BDF20DRAFT_909722 [Mycotypha africana]|uniref:uncharacterized protein n=1 Tax=Mycotypha africana TaxID=64632 RepID=UPI00230089B8|nr:uncharacterized protein BDF20DRAFT_909722 [Mycotypha africana]KAI8992032.1 hypothetical protein BDF20DRAFT_909722 [Mycotypha africana]
MGAAKPTDLSFYSEAERAILQRQFERSRFYQIQHQLPIEKQHQPKILNIFDFDSTLFLSPLLSPNLWDMSLINALTTENLIGPGWWRDLRSLQVLSETSHDDTDTCKQQPQQKTYPDYSHFWNEDIVKEVERSFEDPDCMTVLLTGRRYHPFHKLIKEILASRGLDKFDVVGLRPDPIDITPHSNPIIADGLRYNFEPNVFKNTMSFKSAFIINLLKAVPSLKNITMWDDRTKHVDEFRAYLKQLTLEGLIEKGLIVYVSPVKPKYHPNWELKTIENMLNSHNRAVNEFRKSYNKSQPPINSNHINRTKLLDKRQRKAFGGPLVSLHIHGQRICSYNLVSLRRVERYVVLKLSQNTVTHLHEQFCDYYEKELKAAGDGKSWERMYAETPVFFGNEIFLSGPKPKQRIKFVQQETSKIQFTIVGMSQVSFEQGFALKVKLVNGNVVEKGSPTYNLPLWSKPSNYHNILMKKYSLAPNKPDIEEEFKLNKNLLNGTIGYNTSWTLNNLDTN